MSLILSQAPAQEPITLAEARLHCRIDGSDEDALLAIYIASARETCEHETGRRLITQRWDLKLDAFPAAEIEIPLQPVQSVVSLSYVDTAGNTQTVTGANYSLDPSTRLRAWLLPAVGYSWPDTADVANAVTLRVSAGYGDTGAAVPQALRSWMLLQIGAAYRNREAFASGFSVEALPDRFVDRLLDPYRVYL